MKMPGLKKEGACQLKRMTSRSSDLWSFKLALTIKKQVCDPYSRTAITPVHSKFDQRRKRNATKHAIEKLIRHNDVFADIVNVLLFDGKERLPYQELQDSEYRTEGRTRQHAAHIEKRWSGLTFQIHCIGYDAASMEDSDLPMELYCDTMDDYVDKASQHESDELMGPIVPLVLDFRTANRSTAPSTLKELLNPDPKIDRFVSDFRINRFDLAWLPESTVEKFKSDFRAVIQALIQQRKRQ